MYGLAGMAAALIARNSHVNVVTPCKQALSQASPRKS